MATVLPWLTTVVRPVALLRSTVPPVVLLVSVIDSIFLRDAGVAEVMTVADKASVPAPPSRESLEFKVCELDDSEPSKVSLAVVPVKLFAPVVSGLIPAKRNRLI